MRKQLAILFLFASVLTSAKDNPKYPVSALPENLKKGMYAVIRDKEMRYEINAINSATRYYRIAITILNVNAKDFATEFVSYDKFRIVKSFKCTSYDAEGNVIKKLKQNEIVDRSYSGEGTFFSDSRYKRADLSNGSYPYTVEFEYEIQEKCLYEIPDLFLYDDDEVSIEHFKYSVIFPKSLTPRYKLFKVDEPKRGVSVDGRESFEWMFKDFVPGKFESMRPDATRSIPNVRLAPVNFEFDGYAGRMDTWKEYGIWQGQLNKGRDVLPEETKSKIKALTQQATTVEEKTRIVYNYLQSKTRYVSIQLGIGGLQPFEASMVDKNGYGDCKALSNYAVSLLKAAGVTGYYTTIYGGDSAPEVDREFPSDQSNHIIVAVPNEKDTIWLECTSQTNPFGYVGNFTGGRYGMMVTENGGKLVRTTCYPTEQNVQSTTAEVSVTETGDATAKTKTTYRGLQYENGNLDFVVNYQADDQKKWLQQNVQIPTFDINSFSFVNIKSRIPVAEVKIDLALKRFASVSGKRLFITPNLMNRSAFLPEKLEKRRNPVVSKTGSIDLDTIHYVLPDGIYPEFLPQPVAIKSRFGEYEASFKIDEKGLVYIRRLQINKGEFPAESYQEFSDFYRSVNKADNTKVVFVNKT